MLIVVLAACLCGTVDPPQEGERSVLRTEREAAAASIMPVRALRKNAVLVEIGLNTLVGAGLQYSRNFTPFITLDTGFGLGFQSMKTGLRLRGNFLTSDFTPFVAAGVMYATASPRVLETSDRGNLIAYQIRPSAFAQGTLGLSWTTRSGFSMLAGLGWAQLLRHSNVSIKAGTPTGNQMDRLTFSAGSGPTGELAMGYSF